MLVQGACIHIHASPGTWRAIFDGETSSMCEKIGETHLLTDDAAVAGAVRKGCSIEGAVWLWAAEDHATKWTKPLTETISLEAEFQELTHGFSLCTIIYTAAVGMACGFPLDH